MRLPITYPVVVALCGTLAEVIRGNNNNNNDVYV
jgi:hypothetical protein